VCSGAAGGVILDSETALDDDEGDDDDVDRAADGDGDLAAFQQDGQEGGMMLVIVARESDRQTNEGEAKTEC